VDYQPTCQCPAFGLVAAVVVLLQVALCQVVLHQVVPIQEILHLGILLRADLLQVDLLWADLLLYDLHRVLWVLPCIEYFGPIEIFELDVLHLVGQVSLTGLLDIVQHHLLLSCVWFRD
jgi:hypothetical protein